MFGLDDWIASLSDGASVGVVLLVAVLLGLRHATDPDHIAAMTTLVASGRERVARSAAELGAWWGVGHGDHARRVRDPDPARRALPAGAPPAGRRDCCRRAHRVPRSAAARPLAPRLLRPACALRTPTVSTGMPFAPRRARSESGSCTAWEAARASACSSSRRFRQRRSRSRRSLLLALFTAVSMTIVTAGFGLTLSRRPVVAASATLIPVLGALSLAFGVWYAAAAWSLAPYPF